MLNKLKNIFKFFFKTDKELLDEIEYDILMNFDVFSPIDVSCTYDLNLDYAVEFCENLLNKHITIFKYQDHPVDKKFQEYYVFKTINNMKEFH